CARPRGIGYYSSLAFW
nr:immunoglobulin heavy chain junction region [Macaca mulatta]MOX96423.1 immunoglobulin heavy chain junction region [Macaca mulatta]